MVVVHEEEWAGLMAKAQEGDKKSYRVLLLSIYPYIKGFLSKKISNPENVEDVAQEVLVSVHRSMSTYSADRPFKPWLNAIISYRSLDFFRKHYRKKSVATEDLDFANFSADLVTNPSHSGEYKDIERALGSLSAKHRKVFELMRIQGHTAEEVSAETGMSVSAVKVSVHRTAHKLKDLLDHE